MTIEIVPFSTDWLPQAAELLARQHKRYRESVPQLPSRFERPQVGQEALATLWGKKYGDGFAALDGQKLVAYLLGDRMVDNPFWGRGGWVREAGCAYDLETGVEVIRDLYAALGAQWVKQGIFNHVAMVLTSDPDLVQAWHSLSFGIQQVHGLFDLAALDPEQPELPQGLSIRRAGADDGPLLYDFADVIWQVQVRAPVWGVMIPEVVEETAASWADIVNDEQALAWLAFRDGEALGVQAFWPADAEDNKLYIPDQCVHLSVAGTKPQARGQGIGGLLTRYTLAEVRRLGYRFCEADWRSTNLLASRFWPKQGFRPVAYRLSRRVDERILWARGL